MSQNQGSGSVDRNESESERSLVKPVVYLFGGLAAALAFPLTVAVAVATDFRGAATRADRLPGVYGKGGIIDGLVAGMYAFAGLGLLVGGALIFVGGSIPVLDGASTPQGGVPTDELQNDTTAAAYTQEFVRRLEQNQNTSVRDVTLRGDTLYLHYNVSATDRANISTQVGQVSGAYARTVVDRRQNGVFWEADELVAIGYQSGTPRVRFRVEGYWAWGWSIGAISRETYAEWVSDTSEIKATLNQSFLDSSRYLHQLESAIEENSRANVSSISQSGDTVFLTYETNNPDERDGQKGYISGIFARVVNDSQWEVTHLQMQAINETHGTVMWARYDYEWYQQYQSGELDEEEIARLINRNTAVERNEWGD